MSGVTLEPPDETAALRHRITFRTARTLAYVSVLELGTCWERTLRRARIPLKYSQGFNPRPRMHFAAPLPVGCGSEAELLDLLLDRAWNSKAIAEALAPATPADLVVLDVAPVPDNAPALSERLIAAEYRVWLRDADPGEMKAGIARLLASESVPLPKRGRRHHGKMYNLRSLILDLRVDLDAPAPWAGLWMRLEARSGATGRPDEVLKALDLADLPQRCFRTRLILQDDSDTS